MLLQMNFYSTLLYLVGCLLHFYVAAFLARFLFKSNYITCADFERLEADFLAILTWSDQEFILKGSTFSQLYWFLKNVWRKASAVSSNELCLCALFCTFKLCEALLFLFLKYLSYFKFCCFPVLFVVGGVHTVFKFVGWKSNEVSWVSLMSSRT